MSTFLWKGQGGRAERRSRALTAPPPPHTHTPTHPHIFTAFLIYSSNSEETQGRLPNHNCFRNLLFFVLAKHTFAAATNLRDPQPGLLLFVPSDLN